MLFLLIPLLSLGTSAQRLSYTVDKNGKFSIDFNGKQWLSGNEVQVAGLSSSKGQLVPMGTPQTTLGVDPLGAYNATTLQWASQTKPTQVLIATSFRTYVSDPGMLVFEQYFPVEVASPSSTLSAQTIFPGFSRKGSPMDFDCFSYHGVFPALQSCSLSTYQESHQGGSPLIIYDSTDSSLPMVVFSPLSSPKAQHMASNADWVGVGIKATVTSIPAGWNQLFVLSAGVGINSGMQAWGDRMLRFTGKPRANLYHDVTHSTIGFWTDNGGYYHYATGLANETYEVVLPKVKAYHDSLGIPFRHWQFDSWFYPKDGPVGPGGGGGAVTNWTSLPSIFPAGMEAIQAKLQVPIVMHNREWSPISDYVKHVPQFEWYLSQKAAVPKDPDAFFRWFFQQQQGWGLSMYEQDWMCTEYDQVEALQTNISLADLWLHGMAYGAQSSGRTVQYCMPYPHDVLAAAAFPAVTNARATGDYFHAPNQWAIGATAMFYWAIGIIPFKDGFYSSTNKQIGGQTVGPELNPDREALMATLSGAMVGPMDGINLLNASRTMTACRGDGYILKPDRPLTTVDTCFKAKTPNCFTYHTHSNIGGIPRVHYIFDNDGTTLTPDMVYLTAADVNNYVVYNWYSGELSRLQATNTLARGYEGHVYAMVTPIVNGWAFLGEPSKYVSCATLRFQTITASDSSLSVQVQGVRGETVSVCVVDAKNLERMCQNVVFSADGTRVVIFQK
jgi:hypothetical protein